MRQHTSPAVLGGSVSSAESPVQVGIQYGCKWKTDLSGYHRDMTRERCITYHSIVSVYHFRSIIELKQGEIDTDL